jgi:hypothetical protein
MHHTMVYDPVNRRVVVMGDEIRTTATGEAMWREALVRRLR